MFPASDWTPIHKQAALDLTVLRPPTLPPNLFALDSTKLLAPDEFAWGFWALPSSTLSMAISRNADSLSIGNNNSSQRSLPQQQQHTVSSTAALFATRWRDHPEPTLTVDDLQQQRQQQQQHQQQQQQQQQQQIQLTSSPESIVQPFIYPQHSHHHRRRMPAMPEPVTHAGKSTKRHRSPQHQQQQKQRSPQQQQQPANQLMSFATLCSELSSVPAAVHKFEHHTSNDLVQPMPSSLFVPSHPFLLEGFCVSSR